MTREEMIHSSLKDYDKVRVTFTDGRILMGWITIKPDGFDITWYDSSANGVEFPLKRIESFGFDVIEDLILLQRRR